MGLYVLLVMVVALVIYLFYAVIYPENSDPHRGMP